MAERVGPTPAPPPDHLDTMVVLDLLATARRWRVNEPFVAGQIDGLSRALVASLNDAGEVPAWLRRELCAFLLEVLWERGRASADEVSDLAERWSDAAKP